MGDLSTHFSRHEFSCRCGCGANAISTELIALLEELRSAFMAPVTINCGCRCPQHNADVGGVKNSQHLYGIAADIVVQGATPSQVYHWLDNHSPQGLGVGLYRSFVHVDVRPQRARWIQ
jgi:uncharacterized protein YcbK (DUF882 family)